MLAKIAKVEDRITKEPKPERVGRFIDLHGAVLVVGARGFLPYIGREGGLLTSTVVEIEENDHGVWLTTNNSIYRLDYEYPKGRKGAVILG